MYVSHQIPKMIYIVTAAFVVFIKYCLAAKELKL